MSASDDMQHRLGGCSSVIKGSRMRVIIGHVSLRHACIGRCGEPVLLIIWESDWPVDAVIRNEVCDCLA